MSALHKLLQISQVGIPPTIQAGNRWPCSSLLVQLDTVVVVVIVVVVVVEIMAVMVLNVTVMDDLRSGESPIVLSALLFFPLHHHSQQQHLFLLLLLLTSSPLIAPSGQTWTARSYNTSAVTCFER